MSAGPSPGTLAWRALRHLEHDPRVAISSPQLAEAIGARPADIPTALRGLERSGHVVGRRRDKHPRSPIFWSLVDQPIYAAAQDAASPPARATGAVSPPGVASPVAAAPECRLEDGEPAADDVPEYRPIDPARAAAARRLAHARAVAAAEPPDTGPVATFADVAEQAVAVPTGIEALVCADVARRQQQGLAKYGTTVAANPLDLEQWLTHLYEEMLDASVYTRRAIEELRKAKSGGVSEGYGKWGGE